MPRLTVTCPECGAMFQPELEECIPVGSMNPDHTYSESAEEFACPQCAEQLEAQVQRRIGTGFVTWIEGPARVAAVQGWDCRRCRFSPSGRRLAAQFGTQLRVFERHGDGWTLRLTTPRGDWYSLIGWQGEDLLLADDAVWDLASDTRLWQDRRAGGFVKETAFDVQRRIVVRGVAIERGSSYGQFLEAHQPEDGEVVRSKIGHVSSFMDHVMRWNRARGVMFCGRPRISTYDAPKDASELELWRYDFEVGVFERVGQARLKRGLVQHGWWAPDGSIYVVAWYRSVSIVPRQTHAYGLVQLDGETLELIREERWVGPQQIDFSVHFKHAEHLATGDILWHSNTLSLLDGATWQVREQLPYVPEIRESVAVTADGTSYAICRPNDVIIVDRATGRAYSLRRARAIPLSSRPPR